MIGNQFASFVDEQINAGESNNCAFTRLAPTFGVSPTTLRRAYRGDAMTLESVRAISAVAGVNQSWFRLSVRGGGNKTNGNGHNHAAGDALMNTFGFKRVSSEVGNEAVLTALVMLAKDRLEQLTR